MEEELELEEELLLLPCGKVRQVCWRTEEELAALQVGLKQTERWDTVCWVGFRVRLTSHWYTDPPA